MACQPKLFEEFTYGCYVWSVKQILKDHDLTCFASTLTNKYLILRHDVDYDIDAALRLAAIEHKHDIHATYFLLIDSDMYNLMNSGIVSTLWHSGHRVGLHYDLSKNSDVYRCAELLSVMGGTQVTDIACHNPSLTEKDKFRGGKWLNSAYADKFIKDTVYISDSCGYWRKGTWDIIPDKIQLNTHPVNWSDTVKDRYVKQEEIRQKKLKEVNDYMDKCVQTWHDHDKGAL